MFLGAREVSLNKVSEVFGKDVKKWLRKLLTGCF